jgi:hypothetical protein
MIPLPTSVSAPLSHSAVVDVLHEVAEAWNRVGIGYAVANGLEGYPQTTGRDVDVVVAPAHLQAAGEIARAVMQRNGMLPVSRCTRELMQHIGICPRGGNAVIIDLFPGLRWGPVRLVEAPRPRGRVGPFAIDPWASFVKRILLHVLVAPGAKFAKAPARLDMTEAERCAAVSALPRLVGESLAAGTMAALNARDVAALERLRPRLRASLAIRSLRRPLRALATAGECIMARIRLATCPSAMPTVSVVGPDGVGKSTLIANVARHAEARLRCPTVAVRHWRPGVLPQLGLLAGRSPPAAGQPPRRTAGRFPWLRSLYYATDFVVGARIRDRRISRDLGLVVYDRGALDMCVDPLRYGLSTDKPIRRLLRFLPRPDLIVLLHDDAWRIRSRKAELDEAEIQRQLDRWLELAADGDVDMVLPVNASSAVLAEQVVERLAQLLLVRLAPDGG